MFVATKSSKEINMPISKENLSALYETMLKIRLVEERIIQIYPSDKIQSPVHLCIGQEAISAGVCAAMQKSDHLYGTYRSHGVYIAKGGDLKKLFAELYAKDTGCARGKGGSMHLVAPEVGLMGCSAIVGSTIPVATGDALAAKLQKSDRVSVAFFGDGAIDEGVFFESLNFAVLKELPILFVCENNRYAIHSRLKDRHKGLEIYKYGESLGLKGERCNGNDATEVYESALNSIQEIRKGSGPKLVEYMTYRWYEHVGISKDHVENYRLLELTKNHEKDDPIALAKKELIEKFGQKAEFFEKVEKRIREEIEAAVNFAEKSPFPDTSRLYEDLYEVPGTGGLAG